MDLTRTQQIGVVVAILCILGAAAIGLHGRHVQDKRTPDEPVYTPPAQPPAPITVTVYVGGAVARPGLYQLPRGARVNDALLAAGGLTPDADTERVNPAAPLDDGQRVDVPFRIGVLTGPPSAGASRPGDRAVPSRPVNLNTATAAELQTLPGIGAVLAGNIIEYRRRAGGFRSVDDLAAVPGIGPKRLAQIRPLATVQ